MLITVDSKNSSLLNEKCHKIEDIKLIKKEIGKLKKVSKKYNCLGLAFPQIGIPKSGFIAKLQSKWEIVLNPEITRMGNLKINYNESCLSVPDFTIQTTRPRKISVRYFNEDGKIIEKTLTGLDAVVFQHEYDHLKGILINQL